MRKSDCLFERSSHLGVGLVLLLIALGFSVIGVTVLPVLGLIVAAPVFLMSFFFFTAQRSRECVLR